LSASLVAVYPAIAARPVPHDESPAHALPSVYVSCGLEKLHFPEEAIILLFSTRISDLLDEMNGDFHVNVAYVLRRLVRALNNLGSCLSEYQ
jgi:hypothetical protein